MGDSNQSERLCVGCSQPLYPSRPAVGGIYLLGCATKGCPGNLAEQYGGAQAPPERCAWWHFLACAIGFHSRDVGQSCWCCGHPFTQ